MAVRGLIRIPLYGLTAHRSVECTQKQGVPNNFRELAGVTARLIRLGYRGQPGTFPGYEDCERCTSEYRPPFIGAATTERCEHIRAFGPSGRRVVSGRRRDGVWREKAVLI